MLLSDLRERTGLPVQRVEVGAVDFLRDSAILTIYYDEPKVEPTARTATPAHTPTLPVNPQVLKP